MCPERARSIVVGIDKQPVPATDEYDHRHRRIPPNAKERSKAVREGF